MFSLFTLLLIYVICFFLDFPADPHTFLVESCSYIIYVCDPGVEGLVVLFGDGIGGVLFPSME